MRTKDDALMRVKLMLFYELVNIEKMVGSFACFFLSNVFVFVVAFSVVVLVLVLDYH